MTALSFASFFLLQYYLKLKKDHPALISIEDGFDEKDYDGWIAMTAAFAKVSIHTHSSTCSQRTVRKQSVSQGLCTGFSSRVLCVCVRVYVSV